MPLTQCSECNCKISTTAEFCPHCGATAWEKPKEKKKKHDCFETVMIGLILGFVLFIFLSPS